MDLPPPPEDAELRNIIDKLAQFVARNGPQFEQMTKNKQKDNPKFRFLYGGEYFNYYQYKVTTEQQILKQREKVAQQQAIIQDSITQHSIQSAPWQQQELPPPLTPQNVSIDEKINNSKQNLLLQQHQLRQQQQEKIEEILNNYKDNCIRSIAEDLQINLMIFEQKLQPIIESCTKDAISAGKQWIFDNSKSRKHCEIISRYMLQKILLKKVSFDLKLHLIYLINDLLHHCFRKSAEDLLQSLKLIVVPAFCNTMIGIDEEKKLKLEKLLILWEKNQYFDLNTIEQLKNPILSMSNYQVGLMTEHGDLIQQVQASTQTQIQQLQKQHDDFVNHLTKPPIVTGLPTLSTLPVASSILANMPPTMVVHDYQHGQQSVPIIPDFSKPPPGFPPHMPLGTPNYPQQNTPPIEPNYINPELLSETTIPKLLYFDLPAGLMIPLLKMEDFNYEPLDPTAIRLPPPQPPTERLLAAVEAFYSPPSRERPRNSEGWEHNGLYEYFREKQHIRQVLKEKNSELENTSMTENPDEEENNDHSNEDKTRSRSRSRSNSPKRRFRSRSRSKSPVNSPRRRSPPHSNSPLIRSPPRRSPPRRSPPRRSPPRRSPPRRSPPGDISHPLIEDDEAKLDESNKGHKLLTKMGWSGQGLGSSEQGRINPISGGEVRDRVDKYKGVGININDPFEKFRKTKSYSFITKIRARDDPPPT